LVSGKGKATLSSVAFAADGGVKGELGRGNIESGECAKKRQLPDIDKA
jgi:hypothetical protein